MTLFKTLVLSLITSIAAEKICEKYSFGEGCNSVCLGCNDGCTDEGECIDGCKKGWFDLDDKHLPRHNCAEPECSSETNCRENNGVCVAPNVCRCPAGDINIVSEIFVGDYGVEGVKCNNLRKTGVKGAVIGFIVLATSITVCGTLDRMINKGKAMGRAKFHQN